MKQELIDELQLLNTQNAEFDKLERSGLKPKKEPLFVELGSLKHSNQKITERGRQ